MSRRLPLLLALASLSCASAPPKTPGEGAAPLAPSPLALTPCTLPDLHRPAQCGTARVLEDRALGHGRTVSLAVVVVPATQSPALPDPVVFIVGGPGESATEEAGVVAELAKASGACATC